ncbi:matrix [Sena Madureira virus]|uniref:Matrix protein n=1 Tax=Sena Madureira virus TaxID=1272957 RepID=A0A0D3R1Q5_9RHAB|nr:matrix [Sena Madureira virus]AJR28442.1 matrix [Sena Madureira virus]
MSWIFGNRDRTQLFDSYLNGSSSDNTSQQDLPTYQIVGDFNLILNKALQSKEDYKDLHKQLVENYTGSYSAKPIVILLVRLTALTLRKDKTERDNHYYSGSFAGIIRLGISVDLPTPPDINRYSFDHSINNSEYRGRYFGSVAYTKRRGESVRNHSTYIKNLARTNPLTFEDFDLSDYKFEINKRHILISQK